MKINIFRIVFLSIIIIFSTINTHSQEITIRVIKEDAVLRLKPNEESLILKNLPIGAVLFVEETLGEWVKARLHPDKDGIVISGYIHSSFVEFKIKPNQTKKEVKPIIIETPKKTEPIIREEKKYIPRKRKMSRAGIKLGISSSNIDMSGNDALSIDWKSISGFAIGVFVNIDMNESVALQPEIYYSKKGARYEESIFGTIYREEFRGDVFEIPILFKLRFPINEYLKPGVFFGPYMSFITNTKLRYGWGGQYDEEDYEKIKDSDFGLALGGGFDYEFREGMITLDIRYNIGITDVYEADPGEDIEVKSNALVVMIGFGF